jgi:succinate dehydrogenase / fumarate reductase cytochrome b subunit
MADVTRGTRPISPHLTIYRRHLSMMMSIVHRITGCGLGVGGLLVVWWFLAAARGPDAFAFADGLLTSWLGGLVLIACLVALWYHFFNGIRHLIWDSGAWFDLEQVRVGGLAVLAATAVMTVVTLIIGWV